MTDRYKQAWNARNAEYIWYRENPDCEPDEDGTPRRIDPLAPSRGIVVAILAVAAVYTAILALVLCARYL